MKQLFSHLKWVALIFAITCLPLWYNLGAPAIFIWDEASYANNALEMALNKDFMVLKSNGEPSLYNVKPPLVIWFQCLSIWLFGPNEFAVRFPSALAGLLTCLAVFFFAKRNFNAMTGLLAVLFLVTTEGYVRHHMTRTGDLDSVLVFFVTAYTLLFFDFLMNEISERQLHRRIALMGFLAFCAFMSKSVAGLMPLLGLAFGAVAVGKGRAVFANRYFYLTSVCVLAGCLAYYAFRGMAQPGYLQKVWFSEYVRFTENIMPWLEAPWSYYLTAMHQKLYTTYLWFLPLSLFLLLNLHEKTRQICLLGWVFCATYLLLISFPSVKLDWYLAPVYPVFSLLLACLLHEIIRLIGRFAKMEQRTWTIAILIALLVFSLPYLKVLEHNAKVEIAEPLEREGHAIRELSNQNPAIRSYKIFMPVEHVEHLDAANFYVKSLNHFQQFEIKMTTDMAHLAPGDTVLCAQKTARNELMEKFTLDTLATLHHGLLLKLN